MTIKQLTELHKLHKEKSLSGRYITNKNISELLDNLDLKFTKSIVGYSVEERPIFSVKIGNGAIKILAWSQMHGNESTTTKALFDLFNVVKNSDALTEILKLCTIQIIPILNPDGAQLYTRNNANDIDLNRDAKNLSQPESKVLRKTFDDYKPDYCLNLHGQRTIFGAGNTGNSATLSFLAPAEDQNRKVTEERKKGMSVIAYIDNMLQQDLPNAIGRYDDGFNINCVGDTFQTLKVPTILYEAGHFKNDYDREITRELIFKSLFYGIEAIYCEIENSNYEEYFDIPENQKNFFDVIIRDAKLKKDDIESVDVAIQFKETLVENEIKFIPVIKQIGNLNGFFAHKEIDAENHLVVNQNSEVLKVANEIDFVMFSNRKILLKS